MKKLESLIQEGSNYLKNEFGLEKPKSEIKFCNKKEWGSLAMKNKAIESIESFYHPRENRVYALSTVPLPDLLHEFLGHALFSEQSFLGKKLKSYEEEIERFEEKYNIPRYAALEVRHSDDDTFRVEKKGYEHLLFCNTHNKEVKEYINLKLGYNNFFEKMRPVQEGFAVWMEKIILQGLGMEDMWKKREEKIKQNECYNHFFQKFLVDESNLGIVSILYSLGFPKSSDRNVLIKFAEENLKSFEGLKYLVKYGSGKRDLDMIAVYDDNVKIQAHHVYKENAADISLLNESLFLNKLKLLDIEMTEPVLTGELLYGNETDYEKIKEWLLCTKPSKEAVEYSKRRSLETYNSAMFFVDQHRYKSYNQLINANNADEISGKILHNKNPGCMSKDLLYALVNLSFSLSYDSTAKHYSNGSNLISFEDILKSDKTLEKVIGYIKSVEHGRKKLTEENTNRLLELTKNKLLESYHS